MTFVGFYYNFIFQFIIYLDVVLCPVKCCNCVLSKLSIACYRQAEIKPKYVNRVFVTMYNRVMDGETYCNQRQWRQNDNDA